MIFRSEFIELNKLKNQEIDLSNTNKILKLIIDNIKINRSPIKIQIKKKFLYFI